MLSFWSNLITPSSRRNGVHDYDIQDLLAHSKPRVTTVYARATYAALEAAEESRSNQSVRCRVQAKNRIERPSSFPHRRIDIGGRGKRKGLVEFGYGQHAGVAEWQTLRT